MDLKAIINLFTDAEIVDSLIRNKGVLRMLKAKNLEVTSFLAKREDTKKEVAASKYCHLEILEKLAEDPDVFVRVEVARNEICSDKILKLLASDSDARVREFVAKNKNSSVETLSILAKDKCMSVRGAVAGNLSCPVEILELLSNDVNGKILCRKMAKKNVVFPTSFLSSNLIV